MWKDSPNALAIYAYEILCELYNRKIKIPRWLIILSTSFSALINLFLNLIVITVFLFFNHVDIMRTALWLPLILIEIYVLSLGLSLFLSAAFVKFRDVSYIWEVILQAMF